MKRRVIKQGNNTLTITLPRKWAERYGVKAGEELEVEERDKQLIINSGGDVTLGEITIHIPKESKLSRRTILMPFSKGYNELKITFEDYAVIDFVNTCLETMIGFEITQQGKNYCVLKNIAQGIENEFKTMLNRLMLVSVTMSKELYEVLKDEKRERIGAIAKMEPLANKLCLFCRRMLNMQQYKGEIKNNSLYRIVCLFEEITDYYRDICKVIASSDKQLKKELLKLLKAISELISLNYALMQKYDQKTFDVFKKTEMSISKEATDLIAGCKGSEALILCNILKILEANHNISEEVF